MLFIKGRLLQDHKKGKGMVFKSIIMAAPTKANGLQTNVSEMVSNSTKMEIIIEAVLKIIMHMGKARTFGLTAKFSKENGTKEESTDTVFGKELRRTLIWANGVIIRCMATESTSGRTETNSKANGRNH